MKTKTFELRPDLLLHVSLATDRKDWMWYFDSKTHIRHYDLFKVGLFAKAGILTGHVGIQAVIGPLFVQLTWLAPTHDFHKLIPASPMDAAAAATNKRAGPPPASVTTSTSPHRPSNCQCPADAHNPACPVHRTPGRAC